MAKKREFGEGPIYTVTNYIWWLLVGNFYFVITNIPLIYILLVLGASKQIPDGFFTVFTLCLIPVGPSITALYSSMGKLIREKDVSITKDFFKAYKTNFLQSLFLWVIFLVFLTIIVVDIRFFNAKGYPAFIPIMFYVFAAFAFILTLYVFPILSRFYMKSKDILRLAIYYSIRKFHITIFNLMSFVVVGFFVVKISSFFILFSVSGLCFLIMYYEKDIIKEIEERVKPDTDNTDKEAEQH